MPVSNSFPITLTVCGDPIVGRALALLLQGTDCDARFLPLSSLSGVGSLDDVQLLLLTAEPDTGRREARRASLVKAGAGEIPTLELVAFAKDGQEEGTWALPKGVVYWPCSTDDLKRRIRTAIFGETGVDLSDRSGGFLARDCVTATHLEMPEEAV